MKAFVSVVAPNHVGFCTDDEVSWDSVGNGIMLYDWQLAHRPMLVVLAFTDSKRTAETLVMRGVPCAIGWEGPVSSEVVTFFTQCFYRVLNLWNNASVATAFHEARACTFHRKRACKLG